VCKHFPCLRKLGVVKNKYLHPIFGWTLRLYIYIYICSIQFDHHHHTGKGRICYPRSYGPETMANNIILLLASITSTTTFIHAFSLSHRWQKHHCCYNPHPLQRHNNHYTPSSRFPIDTVLPLPLLSYQLIRRRFFLMMNSPSENLETGQLYKEDQVRKPSQTKVHTVTVCVVPPPENDHVWQVLSEMRLILKDPGYY